MHLKQVLLCVFAADAGLTSAAVADLGSDYTACQGTAQMLATVVGAHLLHHQICRGLQTKQRRYGDTRTKKLHRSTVTSPRLDWTRMATRPG